MMLNIGVDLSGTLGGGPMHNYCRADTLQAVTTKILGSGPRDPRVDAYNTKVSFCCLDPCQ
jgi:hypothetical protein